MKRILYIAPHSFRIKISESTCNSKVAFALASAGYIVDVYCSASKSTYIEEEGITQQLSCHPNLNIYPIKHTTLNRSGSIVEVIKKILQYCLIYIKTGYYYNGIDFPYQCIKQFLTRKKQNPALSYDVVITRGFNTDYAGIYMKRKLNTKWIANWNDPYPVSRFPFPYGQGFDSKLPILFRKLYHDIQKYADIHTFPNMRLRDYMLSCFTVVSPVNTRVIPHMAHTVLLQSNKPSTVTPCIKISHVGSVEYPRSPRNFLIALARVREKMNIQIDCTFIGGYDSEIKNIIDQYALSDCVRLHEGLPYAKALEFIAQSDISLIIEAICEEGIYLPTKFVDAIQSLTPIMCVSPEKGTLRDLINQYNVGYWCNNQSIENIEFCLLEIIKDYQNHTLPQISPIETSYFFEKDTIDIYKSII